MSDEVREKLTLVFNDGEISGQWYVSATELSNIATYIDYIVDKRGMPDIWDSEDGS